MLQTIALASTQFLQPVWSLATAPGVALSGWQTQPSLPAVIDTASDHAATPKKGLMHRAVSPLLEEMLESPVIAAKPADVNIATSRSCTPGRQVLHMGSPVHSGSIQRTAEQLQLHVTLLSCNVGEPSSSMPEQSAFTVEMPPKVSAQDIDTDHAAVSGTELTIADRLCAHANVSLMETDVSPAAHVQKPVSCDAEPCKMFGTAQAPTDTDVPATSNSASPTEEGGSTCAEQHADKSQGVRSAAEKDGQQVVLGLASSSGRIATDDTVMLDSPAMPTPAGRRVSFTLPEGTKCEQGDRGRTPGKHFQRSPSKASPNKGHFRYSPGKATTPRLRSDLVQRLGMHSNSWSPMSKHMQSGPHTFRQTLTHSPGHGKQQQQLRQSGSLSVRDHRLQDRQSHGNFSGQMHCQLKGKVGGEMPSQQEVPAKAQGGNLSALQQKEQWARQQGRQSDAHVVKQDEAAQVFGRECEEGGAVSADSGYVDIPRRIAWERMASPGKRCNSFQAARQIDPLQQDCREAFLNEKLAFSWKAGQMWAQLDLAGIHITHDTCSQHHAEWKAAAERFIEKRGYVAAERLRATLQLEWQQLKAIRKRCCGPFSPQMADGITQSNMLPHTPKSIVKRHPAFRPSLAGAGMAVGVGSN
ncbi:TPA: hypothetical protein ACH3X1_012099 [Trebouxia sp. C0004]